MNNRTKQASEQPAQQEPVYLVWMKAHCAWMHTDKEGFDKTDEENRWMLYTRPQAREPLTDEQFLELLLRTGTQELVGWATFVGGSIQMQGKIGLLRGAKLLKEFVEAAHGIGEKK